MYIFHFKNFMPKLQLFSILSFEKSVSIHPIFSQIFLIFLNFLSLSVDILQVFLFPFFSISKKRRLLLTNEFVKIEKIHSFEEFWMLILCHIYNLQVCWKKLVKWKKYIFTYVFHLTIFFSNLMQISSVVSKYCFHLTNIFKQYILGSSMGKKMGDNYRYNHENLEVGTFDGRRSEKIKNGGCSNF